MNSILKGNMKLLPYSYANMGKLSVENNKYGLVSG